MCRKGFAPLILNLGTRRGQTQGPAALPLMIHRYPLVRLGGPQSRCGQFGEALCLPGTKPRFLGINPWMTDVN